MTLFGLALNAGDVTYITIIRCRSLRPEVVPAADCLAMQSSAFHQP